MLYETVYVTPGAGTVSVWNPPGGTEVSPEQELSLREIAKSALGSAAVAALFELWERFDANHPKTEPHAYLSLLATRADLAGRGLGQAHVAVDLARWDAAGEPTYRSRATQPKTTAVSGRATGPSPDSRPSWTVRSSPRCGDR